MGGVDLSDVCGVCVCGGVTFLMFAVCVWWGVDLSDVCCVCVGG